MQEYQEICNRYCHKKIWRVQKDLPKLKIVLIAQVGKTEEVTP